MSEPCHVERDIALTFEFLRYLIDHPDMIDEIPDGSELEFIDSDITTAEPAKTCEHDNRRTTIATKRIFEFLQDSPASSS